MNALKSEAASIPGRGLAIGVTVAFTTFKGPQRRDRMREVAREVLGNDVKTYEQVFLFSAQTPAPEPKHIWLDPCWYSLSSDQPVPFIGMEVYR